ncbi:MAG: KH domain-containing protein [Myxococcota bacterium]
MDVETLLERIRQLHPGGAVAAVEIVDDEVLVHCARPGVLIGERGATIGALIESLREWFGREMKISLREIRHAEAVARLVADNVIQNLEAGVALTQLGRLPKNSHRVGAACRIEVHGLGDLQAWQEPADENFLEEDCDVVRDQGTRKGEAFEVVVYLKPPSA